MVPISMLSNSLHRVYFVTVPVYASRLLSQLTVSASSLVLCRFRIQIIAGVMLRCTLRSHCLDVMFLLSLQHLHNVETRFHRPQTFLYSDFQCRDDVSESGLTSRD